jgi:hypothetical protein
VGNPLLVVVLLVVQALLATSWLALLTAPSRLLGVVLATGAGLAADLLLARREHDVVGALASVLAIGLVAAVFAQLVSRQHHRVTEILAAHISAILVVSASSCVIALRGTPQGRDAALLCMAVLTVGSVVMRAVALGVPGSTTVGGGTAGLLLWASVGGAVGAAVLGSEGLVIGLATGVAAAFADLLVVAADGHGRPLLLAALLPLASGAPVSYVLSRVLLG